MKGLVTFIIFIVAVVAVYQFALPAYTRIQESRRELGLIDEIERKFRDAEKEREDTLKRLNSISDENLARLDLLLPSEPLPEELYVFFNTVVGNSGMNLSKLVVAESEKQKKQDTGAFSKHTLSFELEINGSYQSLRKLLDLIENNIRLMDVDKISIARNKNGAYGVLLGGIMYYGN
ncbi:MAG: hypothetical protein A3G60_03385 [Candidatus Ryanbacteria bacterium RIFCSPLOWO2_12_FULL_47_9c]|uniref:Pilus assembly protein PilO n=3 Tax=Parcubacteria group TaxID=1794811 RepID=A0A1G2H6V2_9BACT|nr:MAG: hypothetical protein UX74_C0001G0046 [Parcubacteria group bacterium GW2011_GWA2_47_10b]KKU76527.1 MAG: hypothetical protein UY02_C0018G0008 [Candidatus Giovannonibacteria bacterium GW2011_GWB1_47_6b]KKU86440.1 MAG: hypothetical protein UY14_C0001G0019 [Parcubacteria group bacterium GW2011_GWA1_47_9]OGZ47901.1 MAG: hypothetical protein A3C83_03190 [Candidatus Ryanbacteria bacterium RIFCSPHIGHO2_02_FULL_47_25]OGZ53152.1 MAG: hypothetical protein A3A29_02585 [Candidatus Ryanbacteria bacter